MAAWLERFSNKLPGKLRNFLSKSDSERIPRLLDLGDPRVAIRPLENQDWLCPFCGEQVLAPQWDGSSLTLLEQEEVYAHLAKCAAASAKTRKPELLPWERLVERAVQMRVSAWPNYQVTNADGYWICPHCVKNTGVLMRTWDGSPAPRDWVLPEVFKHLHVCPEYAQSPLEPLSDTEVRGTGLGEREVRQQLLERVQNDPVFRVHDDTGAWIDPFGEQAVEEINLMRSPWGLSVQNAILDYLTSPACPGSRTGWRTDATVEHLSRLAGRLSAQRNAGDPKLSAEAEKELQFLREKVDQLHTAEDAVQEMQKDLAGARTVQLKMLPSKPPEIPGYQVAAFYEPCVALGGDMYHYIDAGEGRTGFMVADVSGHGVEAAMIMSMTMKSFSLRGKGEASPAQVLGLVNQDLASDIPHGKFVTAYYAVLEHATGALRCSRAGHNPAFLLYPADQAIIEKLEGAGLVLGLTKSDLFKRKLQEFQVTLPSGGALLLYTDGIPEAHSTANEQFGDEQLQQLFVEHAHLPPDQIIQRILESLRAHVEGRPIEDDLTLVAIKRL